MYHMFVHNLHAIQHNSNHHSIHPNSSRRSIHQDSIPRESTTCQWTKPVQCALIPEFSELVSDFKFSRPEIPVFEVLPLPEPLAPLHPLVGLLVPLDSPLFSLLAPLPVIEGSLLDHDLL